jgi:2-polyprenyl-6-methoxyphenol hydroxylase-like FAD-dependent oxidoreductase
MTPRNSVPIVVAGGGIGGLACALALAQRGFEILVYEQAPEFGQVGVGLQVAPNALSVLDALGVGTRAKRDALLIERMLMVDAIDGREVCNIPCGPEFVKRFGNPYAVAHRADIHGALLGACVDFPLITLRTNSRVMGYQNQSGSVDIALDTGETIAALALIGADGVRSRVRQQMIGDGEPKPAGAVIYRALVPRESMPQAQQKPYPTLWVGPDAHTIYYPVRDWSVFNFGVTVNAPVDDVWEGETTNEQALAALHGWSPIVTDLVAAQKTFQRYVIRHRDPIDNWTDGAATLLGDAAHPMVQYIAQGAAMALEDAICLAEEVSKHEADIPAAFAAYQATRIVRTARVQLSSLMLDRIYHVKGVERLVRNSMFEARTAKEYYERLSWLFTSPAYVKSPSEFGAESVFRSYSEPKPHAVQ